MPHPTSTPPVIDGRDTEASRFSDAIDSLLSTGKFTWAEDTLRGIQEVVERTGRVTVAQRRAWRTSRRDCGTCGGGSDGELQHLAPGPNRGGVAGRTAGRVQGSAQRVYPPVQEAIAQVETALADCTTGDLIASSAPSACGGPMTARIRQSRLRRGCTPSGETNPIARAWRSGRRR